MSKPTPEDHAAYTGAMRAIAPLSDEELAAGLALARVRELARHDHLLRAGTRAREVAIVVRGVLREYFVMSSGVERTKAFITEGGVSGSLADLVSGTVSRAFIVADEPARLVVARFADLRGLGEKFPGWAALGRASLERVLLSKAEREWELLGLDAAERYAAFRSRYPGLEARIAARHIASYLGITAVHLSRLRAKRARPAR